MEDIEDNSIDMILCDLPYGVTQNKKDIPVPLDKLWEHYNRIIKERGCIALFCQGLFFVDLVNSNRKMFRYDLIWDKVMTTGFLNANRMPLRRHETIAIFYKKLPKYNPQFFYGKKNHSKGTKYLRRGTTNNNYGKFKDIVTQTQSNRKYPHSIVQFRKPHPSKSNHVTEKSVDLCEWLIKTYTDENELVLDNCMGSGTTGVAALKCNRDFIGIEIDQDYFDVAKNRIGSV